MKWLQFFIIVILNLIILFLFYVKYIAIPVHIVHDTKTVYLPSTQQSYVNAAMQQAYTECNRRLSDFQIDVNNNPEFSCN